MITLTAYDAKTDAFLPYENFYYYTLKEAIKRYKEQYGLRYKRGVVMYRTFGSYNNIKRIA